MSDQDVEKVTETEKEVSQTSVDMMTIVVLKSIHAGGLLHLLAMINAIAIINHQGIKSDDHLLVHRHDPHIEDHLLEKTVLGGNNLLGGKKENLCLIHPLIVMIT